MNSSSATVRLRLGDAYTIGRFPGRAAACRDADRGDARRRARARHLHEGIRRRPVRGDDGAAAAAWRSPTIRLILRELVRHVAASRLDRQVTFTPIRDPAGVGNGVHIHLSFLDGDRHPATYDPAANTICPRPAGQFVAGILKYLDSILAITAPSVVSYLRLTPHRWSAAFNNLGFRDREASVRICPVSDLSDIAKRHRLTSSSAPPTPPPARTSSWPPSCMPACKVSRKGSRCRKRPQKTCPCSTRCAQRAATCGCRSRWPTRLSASRQCDGHRLVSGRLRRRLCQAQGGRNCLYGERSQAEICAAYEEVY